MKDSILNAEDYFSKGTTVYVTVEHESHEHYIKYMVLNSNYGVRQHPTAHTLDSIMVNHATEFQEFICEQLRPEYDTKVSGNPILKGWRVLYEYRIILIPGRYIFKEVKLNIIDN